MSSTDIDPNNIATDAEVPIRLPRLITADDYHEFGFVQDMIKHDLGVDGVYVSEVGFCDGQYVGLIHTNCESHNQLVLQLENYYKEAAE